MRILSIDPGYERLGLAIVEPSGKQKEHLVHSECFKTSAKTPFYERLFAIGERIDELLKEYSPTLVVMEKVFFNKNQTTALLVSEIKGVIAYLSQKNGTKVQELTPLQIKQSLTGYGRATKDQVFHMTQQLIDVDISGKIDDEVDAIAVGITACSFFKS